MSYINLRVTDDKGIPRTEVFEWFLKHFNTTKDNTNYPGDYEKYILNKEDPCYLLKYNSSSRWFVDEDPCGRKNITDVFLQEYKGKLDISKLGKGWWITLRCGSTYEVEKIKVDGPDVYVTTYKRRGGTDLTTCAKSWWHKFDGTFNTSKPCTSYGDIVAIHKPDSFQEENTSTYTDNKAEVEAQRNYIFLRCINEYYYFGSQIVKLIHVSDIDNWEDYNLDDEITMTLESIDGKIIYKVITIKDISNWCKDNDVSNKILKKSQEYIPVNMVDLAQLETKVIEQTKPQEISSPSSAIEELMKAILNCK